MPTKPLFICYIKSASVFGLANLSKVLLRKKSIIVFKFCKYAFYKKKNLSLFFKKVNIIIDGILILIVRFLLRLSLASNVTIVRCNMKI